MLVHKYRRLLRAVKKFLFPPDPNCPFGPYHNSVEIFSVASGFSQPTVYWCRACGAICSHEYPTLKPVFTRRPDYRIVAGDSAIFKTRWNKN